ncbi:polysaccharide deacetylase family protein [Alteribacillus sp. JSM 102045]|uniref:polysaccharide deacetylase family protein n=1 Tax=Alteribacillus sp. JSM 102045 TaxID=1562101 RepID=UPI0035BED5B9
MKTLLPLGAFFLFLAACSANSEGTASETEEPEQIEEQTDNQSEEENELSDVDENKEKAAEEENDEDKEETYSPKYEIRKSDWSLQHVEESNERNVLITIDDAPDSHSLEMAEFLAEEKVPAIFFVNGHFINDEKGQENLKAIYDLGFEIGNHTMNHVSLNEISKEETMQEIVDLNDLIEEITGERPVFFRAPFGINTDNSKAILKEEDMTWMNWTYGYDWEEEYMESDALAEIMVNTELLTNGANLLMHDREWTKEALPKMIEHFREEGYGFIHPDEIVR